MKGFILHPTYRTEGGRPVVHLHGRLESGDPFLVRDDTQVPHFFIAAADVARARPLGAIRVHATDLRAMHGGKVSRVEVATPQETPPLRDRLAENGIQTYEADVRFAMRFLIDRGIKGSVDIEPIPETTRPGTPRPAPAVRDAACRVFERPILAPCEWSPALRVLSFDIETDPRGRKLHAISLHGPGIAEVLYVAPAGVAAPAEGEEFHATSFPDEAELLRAFCARVAAADPDVLTGWNVIDFDLRVLEAVGRRVGVPLRLGRTEEPARLRLDDSFMRTSSAEVTGRVVLDGMALLRGAFVKLDDYRLETAARSILGEGKLIGSKHRAEEIERIYREDLPRFLAYSFTDARLVSGILAKAGLVDLAVRRSLLTGMPLDRVSAAIASFDFLYLHELRKRGFVAPSVRSVEITEPTAGGAVLEPVTGIHENVLVFDFRSLYPSLIRTYNIDPLALVKDAAGPGPRKSGAAAAGLIVAPNGARFSREPAILPGLLDRLFAERAAARLRGDAIASQALKILMNSFYGVLATPACRFYSAAVANAITHFGHATLLWTKERAESSGHAVLYGDTDSLFVAAGVAEAAGARALGERLAGTLTRELADRVREAHGVRSRLELQFQRLYLRLFLPAVRHGTAGARKRYAGLVEENGREEIVFTGMEMVRRDWTEAAKIFQRGLFERLFRGEEVTAYVREFIDDLRAGRHDEHLVYRKALRKDIAEYTATTPPHVRAARLMPGRPSGLIEYVMTSNGPEPAATRTGSFDYEHYIDRQIRPVAEAVLVHLGLSFDAVTGRAPADDGTTQLDLF
ncbi:MAG: DNA polymerase II [Acidobacteria bacterium]|nr:DNA polymerase II [Acidobacteriota bacterium]